MTGARKLTEAANWSKSSLSEGAGDCVEATLLTAVALRDSKDPDGPCLVFTVSEWDAFLGGVRLGEFDVRRLAQVLTG
ncbi:DUF397 domain-containing protein [Actinomadura sp. KC216]|uniref:DUF397 domain-containing protein n=1 Tax=Actinomadura sp. KC216 TaxID=2530370 RepID=UPI00104D6025|nr:DUF397 domain-containing protein [Actinomadura sp. KC216]TDB86950.1 DUF397 domain-containing protein [Actinomadura sp. KC216]